MTIKDLAMVQSVGIDIKVVEPDTEGKPVEKASFNSDYYGIITEEFLSQEIASMTVRKTSGQTVYIEVVAADEDGNTGDTTGDTPGDPDGGADPAGD